MARQGLLDGREVRPGAEENAFTALQASEVDRRLRFPDPFTHARRAASLDGCSLHAGVRIHEHGREGLEELCRCAVRPPFALHRLSQGPDGRLTSREAPAPERAGPRYRVPWAELLKRIFALDVLECLRCAGRLEVIASIAEVGVAKRILDHLGLDAQGPPLALARSPDDPAGAGDDGPDSHAADQSYDE